MGRVLLPALLWHRIKQSAVALIFVNNGPEIFQYLAFDCSQFQLKERVTTWYYNALKIVVLNSTEFG
jgi:hypothetical protein